MLPILISKDSEKLSYSCLLETILNQGIKNGAYLELAPCILSIPYTETGWNDFLRCQDLYLSATDGLGREGLKRAQRVYATTEYRRSKPSYRKRLIQYPDTPRKKNYPYTHVDQIACIAKDLASKPGYSCLSFTVLRPSDLIDKFRPGYVPCLTAGDFKFRNNKLNLNVLFRTCDALMLGFHDIYYMRLLQNEVLCMAKELTNNEKLLAGEIGELNIYFSRIFINKYIKSKNSTSMGVDIAKQVIQALRSP